MWRLKSTHKHDVIKVIDIDTTVEFIREFERACIAKVSIYCKIGHWEFLNQVVTPKDKNVYHVLGYRVYH